MYSRVIHICLSLLSFLVALDLETLIRADAFNPVT